MPDEMVRVRCDAPLEVAVHHTGSLEPKIDVVEAHLLDAHLTVAAAMYVGVSGRPHGRAKATYRLLDESFILQDDDECPCPRH